MNYRLSALPVFFYSDASLRCVSCGSGPVSIADGFMTQRCSNCGRYSHPEPAMNIDLKNILLNAYKRIVQVSKSLSRCAKEKL
jgi:hypothetical protein